MIFVMVPILPAEAAGLEDTERVEIVTGYVKWVPHCVQKMVIPHRIFCCIITLIAGSYPAH